jgi:hypothetical protein
MKNIRNFYKQYNNPQSTVGQGVRYYVNKHLGNIIFQPPPFSDFLNKSVKYETQPCHILDVDIVPTAPPMPPSPPVPPNPAPVREPIVLVEQPVPPKQQPATPREHIYLQNFIRSCYISWLFWAECLLPRRRKSGGI